jgi:L-ascorbate metabolism protein UlaG (beta-lactamase superfamily)
MCRKLALATFVSAVVFTCGLTAQSPSHDNDSQVPLEYLGAAGWSITDGTIVILIDPYLSRIIGPPPPGRPFSRAPGDTRRMYGWDDAAEPDTAAIDSHLKRADFILVTHTH